MKHIVLLLFSILALQVQAQEKDLAYYYNQAREAYRKKAFPRFYEMIAEAHRIHPYHQGVLYQLGLAEALTGHKDDALIHLRKAILIDATFPLEGLADLESIRNLPGFASILALQKSLQQPEIHSDTAFVLHDRSLHAEGIAFDSRQNSFFVGSIHQKKIVRVGIDGTASDFCSAGFGGMTSVFGVRMNPKKNTLWVCSSPMAEMMDVDSTARSAVFAFDAGTGKLLHTFRRPMSEKDGIYGDLVISEKGEVYVSESQTNTIFKVIEATGQLEPWFTAPDFINIQGIAFSDHDRYLFIADYVKGLFRLDTKSKTLTALTCTLDVSLKGIDGLSWYHQSLIAIQNGVSPARVVRYFLNPNLDRVLRFETLERKHPAFSEPTLGTLSGDTFYYIANSQWGGYDQAHRIKPDSELQDILVLKLKLKD